MCIELHPKEWYSKNAQTIHSFVWFVVIERTVLLQQGGSIFNPSVSCTVAAVQEVSVVIFLWVIT